MLSSLKKGRVKHRLKEYFNRRIRYQFNRIFHPLTYKKILIKLKELGIEKGDLICVHCRFSALGFVKNGPVEFIRALEDAVGPEGNIMMPAFSTTGSMLSYLESEEIFDAARTPSKVGLLTEVFRRQDGVIRSLHPTNSVAAKGPLAVELLKDHEKSYTPYGLETPFGRLPKHNGKILMIHTHIHSFLHHVQELVNFPNLFLEDERLVRFRKLDGKEATMKTKAMRPRVPYFVIIEGNGMHAKDYAILHDYALIFPETRQPMTIENGYKLQNYPFIWNRRKSLIEKGVLKEVNIGRAKVGLLKSAEFLSIILPEFNNLIEKYRDLYKVESIEKADLHYF